MNRITTCSLLLTAGLAGSAAAQTSWPMYQGNAGHTGYLPVSIDPASLVQRYSIRLSLVSALNPVTVADGKVFVTTLYDTVHALDASTGAILWSATYHSDSVNPPSFDDGKVYLLSSRGNGDTWLRCSDAASGQQLFQAPIASQGQRYFGPTIRDHLVFTGGGVNGGMYAIDGGSGQQLWFRVLPQFNQWTPAVDGDAVYGYVGAALYVLDRSTGAERFHIDDLNFDLGSGSYGAPILGGNHDVLAQQGRRLLRFDLQTRRIAWETGEAFTGQPAVHDGVIYANSSTGLQALDQLTGAPLWSCPPTGLVGNVIVTASHFLVHSNTTTFLVDRQTRAVVWSTPHGGNISIGDGALYISRLDGWLDCIGFAALPTLTRVEPTRADYAAGPVTATITGTGFGLGTGMQVLFGGVPATDVVIGGDQTLTCRTPVHAPGIVDVTLQNSIGHVVARGAFAFTPAVGLGGERSPGTTAVLSFVQAPRELLLAGYGFGPRVQVPVPPFAGALQIPRPEILFATPFWPTERFDLPLGIPADPTLLGADVLFQSLIGHGIYSGAGGAFSNCVELLVQ